MSMQQYLISNQVQHLTRLLSDAREKNPSWLFVAGHYPIYSAGSHGDTSELLYYLLPLLKTYKVDAYFCGHDHISEHLEKDGIHFFVVGAGSMTDNIEQESNANLLWYGVKYSAFASMAVSNSMMNITYIDLNGTVRYNYTIEREGSTFEENTINQSDDDVSSFKVANKWFQDIFGNSSPRAKYFVAGSTMILVLLIVFLGFVRFAKTYPKPMAKNIRLLRSNPLKSAHPTATTATSNISTDTEEAEIATAYKRYFGNSSTYQRLSGGSAYQPDTFPRRFNETPEKLQVQRSATGRILYGHNRSISDRAVNYFGRSTHYQTETANRTNIDVRALKIAEEDDYADLINKTTEL